ncbi:ATP-binding protein [uncultured Legionella sp.]|uniref:PAS domain-containing hybrid sensor histidine kinase/response regulator n=1 Tax=uncultured Legionella sp. TaxID=210934 RepID=UPI00260672D9|nr:ATP-binding protein [uncultured Legionella sp.]
MNRKKQPLTVDSQLVQSLLNAISNPVVWISEHDVVLDINDAAQHAWNIKKEHLLGHTLSYTQHSPEGEESVLYPALIQIEEQEYTGLIVTTEHPSSSNNHHLDVISHYLLTPLTQNAKNNDQDIYQYMENIIAEIPISVYWMNAEYIYLGCSNDMAKLLRLKSRHDIIGKTYSDLYDEQSGAYYKKADQEVIQKGVSLSIEEPLYQPDGVKEIYLSKKVPLKNPQGLIIGMLGISVNITERIKMEHALEQAKKQAEAANAAKTEFIANMSHDIRTPLTGVIGLSEILEQNLQDPKDKEKAHMLHNSGEELLQMLNDILDDVRADNLSESDVKSESFDVHQCIHDLIRLESPATALKNLSLKAEIASNVPCYIKSDYNKIQRILLNLTGNAIKFTQSGCITLSIECLHHEGDTVHLKFSVSDTGIGIPETVQALVFNQFFKVSSSYNGSYSGHGLGLHIAQTYVELLGGHITLTSKEGVGSTFHFDIECSLGQEPALNPKRNPPPRPPSSSKQTAHLLLVEDNIIALKTLEFLLTQKKYTFSSATTGEEAWAMWNNHSFDLMITDIGLPGISGTELTKRVREQEQKHNVPRFPIIGLTGHARDSALAECIESGMDDVLSKPAQIERLHSCIQQWVQLNKNHEATDSTSGTVSLGADLPNTEDELFQLEHLSVFDEELALKLCPDKPLLITLLQRCISDFMQQDITQLKEAYKQHDWAKIEKITHKIKGGMAYLGTQKMYFSCQYFERYYKAGHRKLLDPLYHQLIRTNDETCTVLRSWLKHN